MEPEALYVSAALLIFFGYFCYVLWSAWKSPKDYLDAHRNLPLED